MKLWLLLVLVLLGCSATGIFGVDRQAINSDTREVFLDTFNSPDCSNPCWLGIEVGVTKRGTVLSILEEHDIEYSVPGVIHLHSVPNDSVLGINSEDVPPLNLNHETNVLGDINVGQRDSDIVQSIDFVLDLCVATVVNAYGEPAVWFTQDGIPTTLAYHDYQLLFFVNPSNQRINGVILHIEENMPSPNDLDDWTKYADAFSDDCTDVFTN